MNEDKKIAGIYILVILNLYINLLYYVRQNFHRGWKFLLP